MNRIFTIVVTSALITFGAAHAADLTKWKKDPTVAHSDGTNARESKSYSHQIGKSNFDVVGSKTTQVTNGYRVDGQGSPIRGNNTGSSENTTLGVGIRYNY
jgi:opacity protein-like surface antigen